MRDTNSFSDQLKNSQEMSYSSAESSLITLGRVQKLDLLIHLITNLRQSLVICGVSGIGKTTLLNELEKQTKDSWAIIKLSTSASSSYEAILEQLQNFITQSKPEYKKQNLLSILSILDEKNQKIVMVFDDAGSLVPGLINSLIQYAEANGCLRIVFALNHDDLHEKNRSDRAIENCHFIEIPPLTEIQCGTFLQNLSAKPAASLSFDSINDALIEKIYKETHGIPGNIISALPKMSGYTAAAGTKGLGLIAIVLVLIIGTVSFFFNDKEAEQEIPQTILPIVLPKPEQVNISSPVVSSSYQKRIENSEQSKEIISADKAEDNINPLILNAEVKLLNEQKLGVVVSGRSAVKAVKENNEDIIEKIDFNTTDHVSNTAMLVGSAVEVIKEDEKIVPDVSTEILKVKTPEVKQAKEIKKQLDDRMWLHKQPPSNQTIQLIALSTRKAVMAFIDKNQSLKQNLKFLQMIKQGKETYLVIYGNYSSNGIASNKMKQLPVKYRKSWIRRIKDLQKVIKK